MSTSQATGNSSRRRSRGGGSRNRNNNRNRSGGRPNRRPAKAPEPSFGQKFLKVITFGLAGGAPAKPASSGNRSRNNNSSRSSNNNRSRNGGSSSSRRQSGGRNRSPEIVAVTNSRLYVGNLSYDATESDLFELFSGAGAVQNAEIVSHKYSQRSKGYAFIEMGSTDEAQRAVDILHDQDFMGRKLVVSGAKSRGPHEDTLADRDE
ncbi:MAG: RNA-binding protein [Verrucomicrobiota bacterium]